MTASLELDAAAFAVWARDAGVWLPYPLDLADVDAVAAIPPPAARELVALQRICGAPRAAAFAMRTDPTGATDVHVAVGGERDAVLVAFDGTAVGLTVLRETDLVAGVGAGLPHLAPLDVARVEIAEDAWNAGFRQLATADTAGARTTLVRAGIADTMVSAMVAALDAPVPIGTLGATAWQDGVARLGPTLGSWFEYPAGAVLSGLVTPRHATRRHVSVEPYTQDGAVRVLLEAYAAAHRAVDPARRR